MPRDSYYFGTRRLVSQDDSAIIQRKRIPRSKFINRFNRLTTFDAGKIYPFMVDEILPGDHMRYNVMAYVRMSTALFPTFSNQRFDTHFFYTPARILWANWTRLMGEQVEPNESIALTVPVIELTNAQLALNSIFDHMGLPHGNITGAETINVNALPFRAYNQIYNQWFRDENLIAGLTTQYNSNGPDNQNLFSIQRRAKSHDYFTSALPWPQKFTPLQTLFTGTAPVIGIGAVDTSPMSAAGATYRESDGGNAVYPGSILQNDAGSKIAFRFDVNANVGDSNPPRIYADLAQATGVTINALRQAWLVQDLLEAYARGGTRYVELLRSIFGVTSPDFRLQRPEYIGGGQTPINLTPIAQTTPTGGGGLGALGATGTAAGSHSASYAATEHGYILGLLSVRTELAYQQGLHKLWTRSTLYDFYNPLLAGLGEQAVLRQEIFCTGVDAEDAIVFGYQERWQEYRTRYSDVTGMFRTAAVGNIDEWHLVQQFSPAPTLSQAFIEDTPPMARILAAGSAADNMQYLADIVIERTAIRPIPTFGTPATLARF